MASSPKVLIAGAGPVGLTLANELVRQGISVRIVDKNVERTDKSKALVLWSRTLELFDDAGYASDFLPAGMPAHGAQISTGKEIVASVSLDSIDSRFNYALMIAQSETERILEQRLAAAGVTVERRVELAGFTDKGTGVEATLRKQDGSSETVRADWLVGCDGAHSAVRRARYSSRETAAESRLGRERVRSATVAFMEISIAGVGRGDAVRERRSAEILVCPFSFFAENRLRRGGPSRGRSWASRLQMRALRRVCARWRRAGGGG